MKPNALLWHFDRPQFAPSRAGSREIFRLAVSISFSRQHDTVLEVNGNAVRRKLTPSNDAIFSSTLIPAAAVGLLIGY